MTPRKTALPALALAALLAGTAGLGALAVQPAAAQTATTQTQAPRPHERHRFGRVNDIDGRIAYLKAELKITDAQAPLFDKVAQAMRDNAKAVHQVVEQMRGSRGQPQSAVQRLEVRSQFAALRAQASERYLTAFKPLYAALSDQQKKTADELLASHHHRGHRI